MDHAYGNSPKPDLREPEDVTEWPDGVHRLGVDRNDIPIILHLPNWHREQSLVGNLMLQKPCVLILTTQQNIFNQICLQLSKVMPPTSGDGADKNWRNQEDNYRRAKGEVTGRIKIATAWHAIGHSVSSLLCLIFIESLSFGQKDDPVPSSTILASGRKFAAATRALQEFETLGHRLNTILKELDPGSAAQYEELREKAQDEFAFLRALNTLDPSLWQGRMILFNSQAPPHVDSRNPPAEWTPLLAGGNFTSGGCLFIHNIKLRLRYLPGDLIFIRGWALTHSVEQWEGGQRISIVYFTHESVWQHFKCRLTL